MSEKKYSINNMLLAFIAVVIVIGLVSLAGFSLLTPPDDIIMGQAEATQVRISGKVPGRIEAYRFGEGDRVHAGDTLVYLNTPEVDAKLRQAEAVRSAAEANYQAMVATEKAAHSQYDMAREGARREDKAAASALVRQAGGVVDEVEAYLGERALTSPIDGEVVERFPQIGELVGTGAPIMNIADLNDMWVTFSVREDLLRDIKIGAEIRGFIPALGDKEVVMKVYFMKDMGTYAAWKATKTTGQYDSKTFEVRARPTSPVADLRPGMSVIIKRPSKR